MHAPFDSKPEKTRKHAGKARASDGILKNPAYSGMEFSSGATGALGIRLGKWKYFEGHGEAGHAEFAEYKSCWLDPAPGALPGQLYNLEEDLGEMNNLHDQHPEIVTRMKRTLEEIKDGSPAPGGVRRD